MWASRPGRLNKGGEGTPSGKASYSIPCGLCRRGFHLPFFPTYSRISRLSGGDFNKQEKIFPFSP